MYPESSESVELLQKIAKEVANLQSHVADKRCHLAPKSEEVLLDLLERDLLFYWHERGNIVASFYLWPIGENIYRLGGAFSIKAHFFDTERRRDLLQQHSEKILIAQFHKKLGKKYLVPLGFKSFDEVQFQHTHPQYYRAYKSTTADEPLFLNEEYFVYFPDQK